MTITNNKEAYRTALVLAITAPNDKLAAECEAIAHGLEKTLTRGEIKLIRKYGLSIVLENNCNKQKTIYINCTNNVENLLLIVEEISEQGALII